MLKLIRRFGALLAGASTTAIIASVFSTQSVLAGLQSVNVDIPFSTRLSMTLSDFGILAGLIPITCICFIVGFIVAALCQRKFGGNRIIWMMFAGACALMATLLLFKVIFLITPFAGARSTLGFISFGLAGGIGGWVYAKLSVTKTSVSTTIKTKVSSAK